jgi:hypothetical protein
LIAQRNWCFEAKPTVVDPTFVKTIEIKATLPPQLKIKYPPSKQTILKAKKLPSKEQRSRRPFVDFLCNELQSQPQFINAYRTLVKRKKESKNNSSVPEGSDNDKHADELHFNGNSKKQRIIDEDL